MVHVTLGYFVVIQAVQTLCIGKRCQGRNVADLSLSTGEHSGTMYSRNDIDLSCQRTDLSDSTTVRTLVILQDHLTHGLLLKLVYSLADQRNPLGMCLGITLSKLLFYFFDVCFTSLLIICENSGLHCLRGNECYHIIPHISGSIDALVSVLRLTALIHDVLDESDDILVEVVCCIDRLNHNVFRNFLSAGLDHDDLLLCGSYGKSQIGYLLLLSGRVEDQLAVDETHMGRRDRAVKRDIRNAGSDGSADHSGQLRAASGIYAHNKAVQGYVVAVILREQRTHRTVDNTGCKDRILRCAALTTVETARDLSDCVHLLLVLYGQREEIDTVTRLVRSGCGTQKNGLTVVDESRSVCLGSDSSDIYAKFTSCQVHGK